MASSLPFFCKVDGNGDGFISSRVVCCFGRELGRPSGGFPGNFRVGYKRHSIWDPGGMQTCWDDVRSVDAVEMIVYPFLFCLKMKL